MLAYDFVALRTSDGRPVRLLTVVDEYTRECLAIQVGRSLRSSHVIECLGDIMVQRGVPDHVRSDNGPEFTAKAVRLWLQGVGAKTLFITPGSPLGEWDVRASTASLGTNSWTGSSSIPSGGAGTHTAVASRVQPPTPPQRFGLSASCPQCRPGLFFCSKGYQCLMICGTTIGGRSPAHQVGVGLDNDDGVRSLPSAFCFSLWETMWCMRVLFPMRVRAT